jgi:hypothetical protein
MPNADTPTVILRSICVGIASLVAVAVVCLSVGIATAFRGASINVPSGGRGTEVGVGVDLVTLVRNASPTAILLPLLAFAIGFYLSFRYFSKSAAGKKDGAE